MAKCPDWIQDAADELSMMHDEPEHVVEHIQETIAKHCPMESDVAYMKVPRCDGCDFWARHKKSAADGHGVCVNGRSACFDSVTPADFGCTAFEKEE